MNKDDEQCLKLGREVVRMIRELRGVTQEDTGYTRRKFTFPAGEVDVFIVNSSHLANAFDQAAEHHYSVVTVSPPSERN